VVKPLAVRCCYVERSRRCGRSGAGNPPLCDPHRVALESELESKAARPWQSFSDLIRKAMSGEDVTYTDIHAGLEDLLGGLGAGSGKAERKVMRTDGASQQRQRRSPPPPRSSGHRSDHPQPSLEDDVRARRVLGFAAAGQKLTADDIKKRHRELARIHHPDRGGSVQKMQEINAAVDHLMKTL
jgi:hypothetical protein